LFSNQLFSQLTISNIEITKARNEILIIKPYLHDSLLSAQPLGQSVTEHAQAPALSQPNLHFASQQPVLSGLHLAVPPQFTVSSQMHALSAPHP